MKKIYAEDGVDVEAGDSFSSFAGEICRRSYRNNSKVEVVDMSQGNFRGPRGFRIKDRSLPPGCVLTTAPDGEGTKTVIIDSAGFHAHCGGGIIAMTTMDILRWGGLAIGLSNIFDVAELGKQGSKTNCAARALLRSLGRAAKQAKIVLLNGETAELGSCVGSENPLATLRYNWAAVAIGIYDPSRMILGQNLKVGQSIMALREKGFRNNGLSSARKAFARRYGQDYHQNPEAKSHLRQAAEPAALYDRFLTAMHGWDNGSFKPVIPMHLIVHVTGGSFRSKLAHDMLFPRGFSAKLDDLFDPPPIMKQCAEWRGMTDEECYDTWNGGQGVLVVIDSNQEDIFVRLAQASGHEAKRCGQITSTPSGKNPRVVIDSKFDIGQKVTITKKKRKE